MAFPHDKLADALKALKTLQDRGHRVIRSTRLPRVVRERLVRAGYLRLIIKGWYVPARPEDTPGDSTAWHASMRDFIRGYCDARFGQHWYVSPELSVQLHAGNTVLSRQVVVHAKKGDNNPIALPEGTSLFAYAAKDFAPRASIVEAGGLRVLALPWALARVSAAFFRTYTEDAHIALAQLKGASELLEVLLEGGQSVVAGRLAGALRAIQRPKLADEIRETMRSAGYTVNETNPFERPLAGLELKSAESPYAGRIRLLWRQTRANVLAAFRPEPGLPRDAKAYLLDVEERYATDAYHSLSIEGYRVTEDLIERVRAGRWNPDAVKADTDARNAMAARGYWQAHNAVKQTIKTILAGRNAGRAVREDHRTWYRELFGPSVTVGIVKAAELAGYRNGQVYIRNSMHVPPPREAVRDCMAALFDLLTHEPSAAVRAVLGHFVFVFIHPYMDGNGRMGRFLMNTMLASGGYRWTVVRLERRVEYMGALEQASVNGDIKPFAAFLARMVADQMASKPKRATV
ncbi:MAG: Fic family protein [Betaproteobacteria bacterium]|nr:Fic family protein [Betaproteobacteria bacterium]